MKNQRGQDLVEFALLIPFFFHIYFWYYVLRLSFWRLLNAFQHGPLSSQGGGHRGGNGA